MEAFYRRLSFLFQTQAIAAPICRNMTPVSDIILNDGSKIPAIGLGVYRSAPGEETYSAVLNALRGEYRHIDTAQVYKNEADVGKAFRASKLPRSEVFITTKLWLGSWGYQNARDSINQSLKALGTEYIDLILLHAPGPAQTRAETWRALEDLKAEGKLKSIGVSNFGILHLKKLALTSTVTPSVNQIELHPWCQRVQLVEYCMQQGIYLQAYSPLAKAIKLTEPIVLSLAKKRDATPAQILIAWSLYKGFITLPKSVNPLRQQQNFDSFKVVNLLDKEDITLLDSLEEYLVTGWDPSEDAEV